MKKINIIDVFSGIGLVAVCAGIALLGLAFGRFLAGGEAIGSGLVVAAVACLGSGVLSVAMVSSLRSRETSS